MTYIKQRSSAESLVRGTQEGKYHEPRPNTEVADMRGNALTVRDRQSLNVLNGYGPTGNTTVPGRGAL